MNTLYKTLLGASALTFAAAFPAAADYTLMEDSSLPSVVFVDFTGDAAAPKVIKAPSGSVSVMDPALPQDTGQTSSASSNNASLGGPAAAPKSVNERVEDAIKDLEKKSDKDFEDDIIEDAVAERLLDGATLR